MPIDTREIIEAISALAGERNIRVSLRQSGKGAAICGACSFVAGLLFGPAGLAIGGAAGSVVAYNMTKDSFRPLGEVIMNDLSDMQKKKLVEHVTRAVQDIQPTDLVMLLPLIMNSLSVKDAVLKTVLSFVSSELRLQIID